MKYFIFLLIFAAFIQTSFLPLNLVLIMLVSKTLVEDDNSNLVLAFFAGILVGVLSSQNIGFWALVNLAAVEVARFVKKAPFSQNALTLLPVFGLILLFSRFFEGVFVKQSVQYSLIFWEVLVSVPVYLGIKFWKDK